MKEASETRQQLLDRIGELEARLQHYTGRGQKILDLLSKNFLDLLERDDPENPLKAAELNTIRQFLKDQGLIDLNTGPTNTNHLLKKYPFVSPPQADGNFAVREVSNE